MRITCTSKITGIVHQKDLNVTKADLIKWVSGTVIQKVLPFLSINDREFLISGTTPEEFRKMSAGWEIADYIPEDVDSVIVIPDEEAVLQILELIKQYC